MQVITRFAPSPTGMLHVGNARTALVNFLYARKYSGKFILRIDNTDNERNTDEYQNAIIKDLRWLGLNWDLTFSQLERLQRYENAKQYLINIGRLYECYESSEVLEVKRRCQLASGHPPIYDRSALKLTFDQKEQLKAQGRKPHYRFLIDHKSIMWHDLIKGEIRYEGANISDPIVVREDGTMTYMLCSTVDDIEYDISHIIRGEDHITNTAIQMQMFESLGSVAPQFGHLSLVKTRDDKISKRKSGFEISNLKDQYIEPMAINSFLALIGTSNNVSIYSNLESLIRGFDITKFSTNSVLYNEDDLVKLNHKLIINMEYKDVRDKLVEIGIQNVTEEFWLAVRPNIDKIQDVKTWWNICYKPSLAENQDKDFLSYACKLLPSGELNSNSWNCWIKEIVAKTNRKGKMVFMPLRLALTGVEYGPELKYLLPLIGRTEVEKRLLR